ncbi:hypothetical protein C8R44DRAFT_746189 [Mycena epipterygia]|nr:hypothetical protein C8R44DRAFT_746189 [Mycena epipterygia]
MQKTALATVEDWSRGGSDSRAATRNVWPKMYRMIATATPLVRYFARTRGVDLTLLAPGCGKGGRVEKADVEALIVSASSLSTSTYPHPPLLTGEEEQDVVVGLGHTRRCGIRWSRVLAGVGRDYG